MKLLTVILGVYMLLLAVMPCHCEPQRVTDYTKFKDSGTIGIIAK